MDTTRAAISQETIDQFVGACHGDVATVKRLLDEYPDLTHSTAIWGETPIEAAAQMANREIMEILIAQGAPIDICTAASLGRAEQVEDMLEDDPTLKDAVGAHGIPLMYYPVIVGRSDIAELILARGATVNSGAGAMTPLHGAALFGRADMAAWLLEHGADSSALDYEGKTALQVAEAQGYAQVVALLSGRP
jgi:ankyrin repeat protein